MEKMKGDGTAESPPCMSDTEQKLWESEERYRIAIEHSNDGVSIVKNLTHMFVNKKFVEIFGYDTTEEVRGKPVGFMVHPDDYERVRVYATARQNGEVGPARYEVKGLKKDGSAVFIESSVTTITYEGERASLLYIRDITERKRAEASLKRTEEKYRNIFENAIEGIFQTSLDGRLLSANPAFAKLHGYGSTEELVTTVTDVGHQLYVHPEEREELNRLLAARGSVKGLEQERYRKDGSRMWVSMNVRLVRDEEGKPLYNEGTVVDITDRRRGEENLRAAHQQVLDIIEFLPDATFAVDNDHQVIAWNRAMETMSGVRKQDMLGKKGYAEAVHGEKRLMLIDLIDQEDRDTEAQYTLLRRTGHQIQAEGFYKELRGRRDVHLWGVATPLFDGSGRRIGAIECVRDITEQKNLEMQLLHSQKMEAIGTLAGGVAHDFNNILMALMGYANLLKMKMEQNDPLKVYVDQIVTSTGKAANITQSLLAFSRKQNMELRVQKVNTMIKDVEKLLRRLLPEDIHLVLALGPDATVKADVTQIDQVLMNLATNARDAMPRGGELKITTARVRLDDQFKEIHGFGKPGEYVEVCVSDTGAGIPKSAQGKIFEPFYTTKEAGKGTGLGLSIVYGIIKQHSGYITVSSKPDKGTTFNIYLPAVKESSRTQQAGFDVEMSGGNEMILLAEDNAEIRKVTTDILSFLGYTVIEGLDGEDAVQKFAEHQDRIALVIMDVVMPKKNGREVYEAIRKIRGDVKVLFMSGYNLDMVIDKGILDGRHDYIAKPILPKELLKKVRTMLDS